MKSWATFLWHLTALLISLSLLGWVLFHWLKKSDERGALIGRWIVTLVLAVVLGGIGFQAKDAVSSVFAILAGAVGGLVLAILWVPSLCGWVANQFAGLYDGGDTEVEPQPMYSIAEAKRKQGKYLEAQAEIRVQLNRFPNDFRGWMLLAEIQADDLRDLSGAQDTVEQILSQEGHAPGNISFALNRTADWHLKLRQDPGSARLALERIVQLLPDTEQAQLAEQRIAHLATSKSLIEKLDRPAIAVRHYEENIGLRDDFSDLRPPPEDPAQVAADYVKHLEQHPHDNEAREKLALIYADHYQRLDLASTELEQLIAAPNQLAKHVVHWLNLLADLQIKLSGDAALARTTLGRIGELFPKTAAAANASHRIAYLNLELKTKEKSQAVKLGSYEQNIGLKGKAT